MQISTVRTDKQKLDKHLQYIKYLYFNYTKRTNLGRSKITVITTTTPVVEKKE